MKILNGICAAAVSCAVVFTLLLIPAVEASTEISYITNQGFENDYGAKKVVTEKGNTIIYYSNSALDRKEVGNSDNYLGYTETDGKQVTLVKDEAVTGRADTVLKITRRANQTIEGNARVSVGADTTNRDLRTVSTHIKDSFVHEFEFRMPDIDQATSADACELIAGFQFSSGGEYHVPRIGKTGINIGNYGNIPFSTVGIEALSGNRWYKITEVVNLNDCTMSVYLNDMLLISQCRVESGIIADGKWNETKFKWSLFSFAGGTFDNEINVFIDNIKMYAISSEKAAQMEIDSVVKQISNQSKIYLPLISKKIYQGRRDTETGKMTDTTIINNETPKFSFSSSNPTMVSDTGDWYVASPAGNEADRSVTLSIKSGSIQEDVTITRERPKLTEADAAVAVGVPVVKFDGDNISLESYITSSPETEAAMYLSFYDGEGRLLPDLCIEQNTVTSSGVKFTIKSDIPKDAQAAKMFFWDNEMRPIIAPYDVEFPDYPKILALPEDFGGLSFTVTRKSKMKYTHDATPENQMGGTPLNIYISESPASSGLGLSPDATISYSKFTSNLKSGAYYEKLTNNERKFILNIADRYYSAATSIQPESIDADLIIRSTNAEGTWFGGFARQKNSDEIISGFTLVDGSETTYKTTLKSAAQIAMPINIHATDIHGIPKPYLRAASVDECKNSAGTFYQAVTVGSTAVDAAVYGAEVYVHPFDGEKIEDIDLVKYLSTTNGGYAAQCNYALGKHKLIFDNICFAPYSYRFQPQTAYEDSESAAIMFFNCKFFRGEQNMNAFSIMSPEKDRGGNKINTYNAYLFDCVAAYGLRDGFNYQGSGGVNCRAVEINCISYGNGSNFVSFIKNDKGPFVTNDGHTHSNNGSTAHFGMRMLRVGCKYWDCQGPVVADIDTYSINIGCETGAILDSTTGERTGFLQYNEDKTTYVQKPAFFIDCHAGGEGVRYGFGAGKNKTVFCYDCSVADGIDFSQEASSAALTMGQGGWNTLVKQWGSNETEQGRAFSYTLPQEDSLN